MCQTRLNFILIFQPFFINLHNEWWKTTTKTEAVEPAVGIVLVAKCATGEPGIEEPSAPTNVPNPFKFHSHFPTFLLSIFTKNREKQQRNRRSWIGNRSHTCCDTRNGRSWYRSNQDLGLGPRSHNLDGLNERNQSFVPRHNSIGQWWIHMSLG